MPFPTLDFELTTGRLAWLNSSMPQQSEEFRRDPYFAAQVFQSIFPDPKLRQLCVEAMAESVETAHRSNPNAWELTLFRDKVHLNVGPIAVLYYSAGRDVYCIIDQSSVPKALRNRGEVRLVTRLGGALAAVPESAECIFPAGSAGELFPLIRATHNRLIQAAAARQRASVWCKSYSPGVLEHLSNKVGRQLPHPGYYAGSKGATGLLSPFAVYTIRHSQGLDAAFSKGGTAPAIEHKRWRTALDLFNHAKREGRQLPVIFAAAESVDGLICWGIIEHLVVSGSQTNYRFTDLRRIEPKRPLSTLILRSTGAPLSNRLMRPYAIVRTPDYINEAFREQQAFGDYVAYHSARVMGREYRPPARLFAFISRKPEAYLRKAIGCRAWVISSTSEGSKNRYWLAGMFKPEVVRPERDYFVIQGAGVSPRPPIEITTRRWFERLRQEQAGFSLGFNRIRDTAIAAELQRCLVTQREAVSVSPEELTTSTQYPEGATRKVSVDYYERNPNAREQCIKHHGCHCAVCGFDFEQSYGEIGRGFIHVHHLKALADSRGEYMVDPVEELRPICPNCHAMIHSGRGMLTIEQLKNALRNRPT